MSIEQGKNESLRNYIERFTKEALKVPDLDEKLAMIALQKGTTYVYFKMSIAKHAPQDMNQSQERAVKYIKAEKSMRKSHPQPDNKKRVRMTQTTMLLKSSNKLKNLRNQLPESSKLSSPSMQGLTPKEVKFSWILKKTKTSNGQGLSSMILKIGIKTSTVGITKNSDRTPMIVSNLRMRLSTLSDKVNSTSILWMETTITGTTETTEIITTRGLNHEVMW